MSTYDPKAWQAAYPCGSCAMYVGVTGERRTIVRVGRATKKGVRVQFPAPSGWQIVHPDDLKPVKR